MKPLDVDWCRRQFPALGREAGGRPLVFFDGPAGSQVPERVIGAVSRYLSETNANHGGPFETSRASDALLEGAHRAAADLLGTEDPDLVAFGLNMTTLTLGLSRALARTWKPGDEVLVTRLDHDANFTPWALAARDAGATLRVVELRREDATLDLDNLREQLSRRTRLLALTAASNALGTVPPVARIAALAHEAGALVYVDAVHAAPHRLLDVRALGADFLVASAYKFFGPHVGLLWGRREHLESLPAYKVRPAWDTVPSRWMTGTQSHEGIAGLAAAVEYLADLGRTVDPRAASRRAAHSAAFAAITAREEELGLRLLRGLLRIEGLKVLGIPDPARVGERVPTFSFVHSRRKPREIAAALGARGIQVWAGNFYAFNLSESLGLEPEGMVRVGLLHYNTAEEVDRVLEVLPDALR